MFIVNNCWNPHSVRRAMFGRNLANGRMGPIQPITKRGRSAAKLLITVKADLVDAHFASLNTIHYLLKVLVFDLQSITDQ
jgi:hypothetical protein